MEANSDHHALKTKKKTVFLTWGKGRCMLARFDFYANLQLEVWERRGGRRFVGQKYFWPRKGTRGENKRDHADPGRKAKGHGDTKKLQPKTR